MPLELTLGEVKIYYFLSESFLEELPNINYFTLKLIITKSILIELILPRINSTNAELNTHFIHVNIIDSTLYHINLIFQVVKHPPKLVEKSDFV